MNILLYTAYFPPETGSGPNLFFQMGRALVRRGHNVKVITGMPHYHVTGDASPYTGAKRVRETIDGMNVLRIAVPQGRRHERTGRGLWHLNTGLTSMRSGDFTQDVEVAAVFSPPLFLALASWWKNIPFLLNVQDLFPQTVVELDAIRPGFTLNALRWAEKFFYSRARMIAVHAPSLTQVITARGIPPEKIAYLPNWLDIEPFASNANGAAFRAELSIPADRFVVSFTGVIGWAQGLGVALRAAEELRGHPDILFLFVGDGVEKPALEQEACSRGLANVRFLPMQPQSRYSEILAASDVGLVTLDSRLKVPVIPSKIGSIMAAQRPIIAALPPGDAAQLIRDADAGVVVPAGDGKALAEAILGLRDDVELRRRLAGNGREYAQREFSLESCAPRFEALLERCRTAQ